MSAGRWQAVPLGIWAAVVLGFLGTGRMNDYLHPDYRPGAWVAGGVLALMAAVLWRVRGGCGCGHAGEEHAAHAHEEHTHSDTRWVPLLTLFPLAAALLLSPDRFSSNQLYWRAAAGAYPGGGMTGGEMEPLSREELLEGQERTKEGYYLLHFYDLTIISQDEHMRGVLRDVPVEVVGQIAHPPEHLRQLRTVLYRFTIYCCAADARPVVVELENAPDQEQAPAEQWVRARGTYRAEEVKGQWLPVVRVEEWETAAEPEEYFLY